MISYLLKQLFTALVNKYVEEQSNYENTSNIKT
jgi:hypothetical protein